MRTRRVASHAAAGSRGSRQTIVAAAALVQRLNRCATIGTTSPRRPRAGSRVGQAASRAPRRASGDDERRRQRRGGPRRRTRCATTASARNRERDAAAEIEGHVQDLRQPGEERRRVGVEGDARAGDRRRSRSRATSPARGEHRHVGDGDETRRRRCTRPQDPDEPGSDRVGPHRAPPPRSPRRSHDAGREAHRPAASARDESADPRR